MDFYERKANYFKRVRKLIKQGSGKITRQDVLFDATENAALGEKSVFKYLDMLIERGFIKEKDGVLLDCDKKIAKKG